MSEKIVLTAVGDIGCRIEENSETFDGVRDILKGADINFGSLNELLSGRGEARQVHFRGFEAGDLTGPSGWMPTPEKGADVLSGSGMNVMSFATTRALSMGDIAMQDTIDVLESRGISVVGAGKNIQTARKPAIIDVNGTKVGFLAYCSSVDQGPGSHDKGEVATNVMPGIVPLRAVTYTKTYDLHPGIPPRVSSEMDMHDLRDMTEDIKTLRSQVDVVAVSMHWGVHWIPELIADYQKEAAHAAIDAGADIILGHHAHILKGIEVYKGRAIFYSLGNFSMRRSADYTFKFEEASGNFWISRRGIRVQVDPKCQRYPYDIDSKKSILVKVDIESGKISRVSYVPLWLDDNAVFMPVPGTDPRSTEHLSYMRRISGSQGLDTKLTAQGDEVVLGL